MRQKSEKIILFIDYENIQDIDLTVIKQQNIEIKVFVGKAQNKIPFKLVRSAQKLKSKLEWIKINDSGNNNLDFYIAFYLGQYCKYRKKGTFLVLSKDKGFDSLIKYINNSSINCRRIQNLDFFSQKPETLIQKTDNNKLIIEAIDKLSKIDSKKRPATKKALHNYLKSQLIKKEIQDREIILLLEALFKQNKLVENSDRLTYNF